MQIRPGKEHPVFLPALIKLPVCEEKPLPGAIFLASSGSAGHSLTKCDELF